MLKITQTGLSFILLFSIISCHPDSLSKDHIISTFQTSRAGDNLKLIRPHVKNSVLHDSFTIQIEIDTNIQFQEFIGFGASFTESSAWNLATIPINKRRDILNKLFNPIEGAGFTLTRTHINSCDYSNSHYSYVNENDEELSSFSIQEDLKGFTGAENDQIRNIELVDPSYDLIPMILDALKVENADFNIIASPWSPPSWMKKNETGIMTNGTLQLKYYDAWAKYLSKYVSAYKEQGIDIWGITPQNEPLHSKDARWDSNGFSPNEARNFLKEFLGPQLVKDGHLNLKDLDDGLKVLIYDHNKSMMLDYVKPTYEDPEASKYAWGTAFHWYASSQLEENNWYVNELQKLNNSWPNKGLIHTESSIDIDANDPIDQYWRTCTDYAGTFIPFDTYIYDIINNINNGTQGYVEWCMILSHEGKPNPYNNFNSAPVLINPETDEIIYTPLYYILSHFSKFIKPNARRIKLKGDMKKGVIYTAAKNPDNSIILIVYNKNTESHKLSINLDNKYHDVDVGPQTLQTIRIQTINHY